MLGDKEITDEEILSENKRVIGGIRLALKREYNHCLKEGEKVIYPRVNKTLDNVLENIDKIATVSAGITFVPVAINGVICVVNLAAVLLGALVLFNNTGVEHTNESLEILRGIEDTMNQLGGLTVKFGNGLVKHLPTFLIPVGIKLVNSKASDLLDERNKKKICENERYQEMLIDEMIYIDDIVQMIKDVKADRTDISLNFIQEFLSNVDLRDNSRDFNLQILSCLAEYRVARLKEENNEGKKEESDEKFLDFIDFLKNSKTSDGASKSFIGNEYVRRLIKTYSDETESKKSLMGLEKIKKIISTPCK